MTLGKKLLAFRKKLGMTQAEMGGEIASRATLSRIERDENTVVINDLAKLLAKHQASIVDFLQEFSEIEVGIKNYQHRAMEFFEEKNIRGLEKLEEQLPNKRGILSLIFQDMALVIKGARPKNERQVYRLLNKFDEFSESLLWCLLASIKLYSEKDWSLIVDKALESRKWQETTKQANILLVDIAVTFLSKRRDDFIRDETVMFLQQLLVSEK